MMRGCSIEAFGRVALPRNATKVGKSGALQSVGPAKTSRRDNGVCAALRMVFFERGCHGRTQFRARSE